MTSTRTWLLLGVVGLSGCRMPHTSDETKQPMPAPLAQAPPPITARLVNRNNAHEISQALNDEIERDRRVPPGFVPDLAAAKQTN